MKTIDTKTIYEVFPDLPKRKVNIRCKRCDKVMRVWGEVVAIGWNDYLDGSGETLDFCEPCARIVINFITEKK